jgi:glyceraldehyde 3-phosphate dehydrogenase
MGVNHNEYQKSMTVVPTVVHHNCLAPLAKIVHDNFRDRKRPDDHGPRHHRHTENGGRPVEKGLEGGRAASGNIIPPLRVRQGGDAGHSLLKGKLTGMAFRVLRSTFGGRPDGEPAETAT